MYSSIISYFSLYQAFSHVLGLFLHNNHFFFKFYWKLKGPPFNYQNFTDPRFAFVFCVFNINNCKYLIFVKLKIISQWQNF